ncbi:polyketide synthetase [Microdochium bolleyi]|uniref:Polyketide synthetase n=1 Tax=Microdochium bolleyi TaxID=196109 RepID=A0A136JCP9_9PEZI|nr:polyketide synthetase [Microdochium bolleyi]
MGSAADYGNEYGPNEPIAIVGTGCRFAGEANTPSKLWDLLQNPPDLVSKIPADRFSAEGFHNTNNAYHGNSNVRHSYFLSENVRAFDAQFFGIKPVEANAIDPQQRLLLEVVYEALERGGHPLGQLRGSDTAVYVGVMCGDYEALLLRDTDSMPTYHATGIARSILSNRISYFFDWHGPSMSIDTACSSSLIALHQAVQVLRSGTSRVAVAAGTNLILGMENYIGESKLKMLSPNGRSRMWDADADGYARGEGVAAVVLKRLSDALRDGDVIEAIVRETGTNQDGRTRGITMPSASAQTSLIRQVYRAAGLDPAARPEDRPHFFEAHGTGTPAGDPIEAEAIRDAFFPDAESDDSSVLPVGSIKTVMGHTEGTAGLAAVIKASLAVQHGVIPPNLLFNKLNPKIDEFYKHLHVPTSAQEWPQLQPGQPRRISVNSFGFGGANAHAIIESYILPDTSAEVANGVTERAQQSPVVPFVFSANSQQALRSLVGKFAAFLDDNKTTVDLSDLSWALQTRRSRLPVGVAFSAANVEDLAEQLRRASGNEKANIGSFLSSSSSSSTAAAGKSRILGIFTGQGAQWAGMGRELLERSSFARSRLEYLDTQLQNLPIEDRPNWSLISKIVEKQDIGEASLSQPLCTAVQILLVDLIQAAGVKFHAVVGHSSGEIAAAYAAGTITAEDACRIAYYRGLHAAKACGPEDKTGRMMAVATTRDDAQELCDLPHFRGRLCVAANNGPQSVTMSGDADAVLEAKVVFEDENKGAKVLVVDKAYHSHHMLASAKAYEKDLATLSPKFDLSGGGTDLSNKTRWFSSVYNKDVVEIPDKMDDRYWNANMVGAVLFADALETAWREAGPFDAIIEVGPHPALKRPALDTIKAVAASLPTSSSASGPPPYTGLLSRGHDDVFVFSQGLGSFFAAYEDILLGINRADTTRKAPTLDLPSYPWDHEREYWHESRASRGFRTRETPTHVLLGNLLADGLQEKQLQWRNLLSVREVPWLDGHKLQGQTVFPAAGYCSMALEAGQVLLRLGHGDRTARTMELTDVTIHNALVFQDDDTAVETMFIISDICTTPTGTKEGDGLDGVIEASWILHSSNNTINESALLTPPPMAIKASGKLRIVLGEPSESIMPARGPAEPLMNDVDHDRFYTSLADVGYGYTGRFKTLDNLSRKAGYASGTISHDADSCRDGLVVHPSSLDTAIQAVILAFSYPYDGELSAIHVPTKIRSLRINPELCKKYFSTVPAEGDNVLLPFDAVLGTEEASGLHGDVDVFTPESSSTIFQLEGVECVLFAPATPADDRLIFSSTSWGPLEPDCAVISTDMRATAEQHSLALDLERVCLYYMQQWERQVPADSPVRQPGHDQHGLFRYSAHIREAVASGRHAYARREWLNDGPEVLEAIQKRYSESCLDLRVINVVGSKIPDVVAGNTTILEHLFQDDLLTQYYADAMVFPPYTTYLARAMAQLSHRYPAMDILEVGAGTGHATRKILGEVGSAFGSYTFTDLSAGFLDKAQAKFAESPATSGVVDKMAFRVLDIEKDITSQGYTRHTFDVIVASLVLHATPDLEQTLRNVRALLKPGGYLMLLELTDNAQMRGGFIFGSLPGWWVGENDGRVLSPCIEVDRWDTALRNTGFGGAESVAHNAEDRLPFPAAVIVAQALDDRVKLLREPLDELPLLGAGNGKADQERIGEELLIVGGSTMATSRVIPRIRRHLDSYYESVEVKKTFAEVLDVSPTTTILNLSDLDKPIFEDLTAEAWSGLKAACENARTVLWLTAGAGSGLNPSANMSLGFGRSVLWEVPGLQLQFIDIEQEEKKQSLGLDAVEIANALLRFSLASEWEAKGQLGAMTWSNELELHRVHGDRSDNNSGPLAVYTIPRVKADPAQNNRFNSSQRRITEPVDRKTQAVQVTHEGTDTDRGSWAVDKLASVEDLTRAANGQNLLLIEVQVSSLAALAVSSGALHVVLGKDNVTGAAIVGLSDKPASHALVHRSHSVTLPATPADPAAFLSDICHGLLASAVLEQIASGDVVLVHEPPVELARHISSQAAALGAKVYFTTTSGRAISPEWLPCPANMPLRQLRRILPFKVAAFADLSPLVSSSTIAKQIGQTIALHLPHECQKLVIESLVQSRARLPRAAGDSVIHAHLSRLVDQAGHIAGNGQVEASLLPITSLAGPTLDTIVRPVDYGPLFRADRSYWLVGLTGDLGLSLVEWMRVVDTIRADLPPLSGVAQGAMVLRDTLIRDMDIDTMHSVLRPKVLGSINLQQVLSPGNQPDNLDFFIFFSSMTQVVGNIGQSNYTAANAFMASLAQQRRKAGLAASVINIGAIMGLGYIAREQSQAGQDNLIKGGYQFLSAHAFHHIFGEAVLSGKPGQSEGQEVEISSGLRHVSSTDSRQPVWFPNPRFSHHIIHDGDDDGGKDAAKAGGQGVSVTASLAGATTSEEVLEIVQGGFLAKLENLLKSELASGGNALSLRTDEIGVDSLVAVEIRTWFLKTLQVNVPVLKILGGASIGDILDHAVAQLPKDLTPNIGAAGAPDLKGTAAPQPVAVNGEQISRLQDQTAPATSFDSSAGSTVTPDVSSSPSTPPNGTAIEENQAPPEPTDEILRNGPLSHSQSMFWFVHKFAQDPSTLNHTGLFRLSGRIRVAKLRAAVERVAQHHEALRTMFSDEVHNVCNDDNDLDDISPSRLHPTQSILAKGKFNLETRSIRSSDDAYDAFAELTAHVFDLEHGESMRLMLLSVTADEHYLLIGCHHISVDGWTNNVLMRDIEGAYKDHDLPKTLQYLDYTLRQQEENLNGTWAKDLKFWKQVLAPDAIPDPLPVLPLPGSQSRSVLIKYDFHRIKASLSQQVVDRLTQASRSARATPFQFFLATFRCMIARMAGVQDFAVGVGDANRRSPDTRNAIGAYINIWPLVFSKPAAETFSSMLQDTRDKIMDALTHSSVPFGAVLDSLHLPRSEYHSPIFQTFVDYREGTEQVSQLFGTKMELLEFEGGRTAYDINIDVCNYVGAEDAGAGVELMVQSSIYSADDAKLLLDSYVRLLEAFSEDVNMPVSKAQLHAPGDVQTALRLGQGPSIASAWPETLIHRVVEVAEQHGDKPSVKDGHGNTMTYTELLNRMHIIADALHILGAKPGASIAVLQDRTCDWIASLLAVMHVGGTYLPLDPDTPTARLASIVGDCKPIIIIVDAVTVDAAFGLQNIEYLSASVLDMSQLPTSPAATESSHRNILAAASAPGAILYTSGSTGTPKGIVLLHSNLRNEVEFSALTYNLDTVHGERVLQQSAPGFDMSLTQIFGALAFGGFLYICPASLRADAKSITQIMAQEQITMTGGTPSEYLSWIEAGGAALRSAPWKVAVSGGEAIRETLLKGFESLASEELRLYNAYGPTEVTCSATRQLIDYRQLLSQGAEGIASITAGVAAPNAYVYIVDADGAPVPANVSGEIVVGGAGIANGYLGRPEETAARFVNDEGKSVHKTGDIGRLTAAGELVVQGRIKGDTQVKLRGIRIDLHEVEQALLRGLGAQGIVDVIVTLRKSESSTSSFARDLLVAHALFSSDPPPSSSELQAIVGALPLPAQMKPSITVAVPELPRGSTGKVDRKAVAKLPWTVPQSATTGTDEDRPILPAEKTLRAIWAQVISPDVLGDVSRVKSETDFFHVGGNSLMLVELQREIQSAFDTSVKLVSLFECSTLGRMAQLVSPSIGSNQVDSMDWDAETEPLDLTQAITSSSPVSSPPRVVVLTGATGHLGRELLKQLVLDASIETIHCIAVRAQSAGSIDHLKSLDSGGKIQVHPGDLSSPALGLAPETANAIFSSADVVIHNGANVSHLKHYQTLKAENVGSTAQLVALAQARSIPVHFVSTAGVALFTGQETFHEVSCRQYPPSSEAEGYTASKWASEVLLEKAHQRFGLPVAIHRPSNIARDDVPDLDLFQNLIKYCRMTKAVPDAAGTSMSGFLNLVAVDECASGILSEALRGGNGTDSHVRYPHQIGAVNLSFEKLAEHIAARDVSIGPVATVPLNDWVAMAEEQGMHATVASYFRRAAHGGTIKYPLLVRS